MLLSATGDYAARYFEDLLQQQSGWEVALSCIKLEFFAGILTLSTMWRAVLIYKSLPPGSPCLSSLSVSHLCISLDTGPEQLEESYLCFS